MNVGRRLSAAVAAVFLFTLGFGVHTAPVAQAAGGGAAAGAATGSTPPPVVAAGAATPAEAAAPRGLEAGAGSAVVRLSWEGPASPPGDVLGYRVYRWKGPAAGEPAPVATVPADTTAYTDYEVLNGQSYTYTVRALYDNKVESPDAPRVTVRPEPRALEIVLFLDQSSALVNGAEVTLDSPAQLVRDRTMVPLRFVGTALGASVQYDAGPRRVTVTLGSRVVRLWIDDTGAEINGRYRPIDVPPVLRNGRTLVPVRFITEAFGADVSFDRPAARITVVMADTDVGVDTAGLLIPGVPVTAALNGSNDVDVYRCHVSPGETYRVRTEGLGPGCDTVVALVDPLRGTVQAVDDWPLGGPASEMRFVTQPDAGDVFIRVQSANPGGANPAGNYRLVVERCTRPGDSLATAVRLEGGNPSPGSLRFPSDADYYSFSAAAGQVYRLSVVALPGAAPGGATVPGELILDLLSPDGAPLARDDDPRGAEDGGATLVWECEAGGVYYLRVASRYGKAGPYTVEVAPSGPDEWNDMTRALLTTPDHGSWSDWLASSSDEDWYAFPVLRGTRYHVQTLAPGGWCDTVLTLVGWDGKPLASSDDAAGCGRPDGGSLLSWVATYDGLAYARVTGYPYARETAGTGGSGNGPADSPGAVRPATALGRYSFCVTTTAPETDEHPRTATPIRPGERLVRSLVVMDNDWFSFRAERGRTYTVETGNLRQGCDTCLEVYDGNGNLLGSSDDVSLDAAGKASRVTWTATFSGTVLVRVYPYLDPDGNWSTGPYTLILTEN